MSKVKKDRRIRTTIYLRESELELLKRLASKAHGGNVSLYVRSVALK